MITRHLTSITVSLTPFHRSSRTARLFLSLLPSDARSSGLRVTTTTSPLPAPVPHTKPDGTVVMKRGKVENWVDVVFKDGKNIKLETSKMGIKDLVEEMDRHSRLLGRKEDLQG